MSLYTEEQGQSKEIHVAAQAREVFDVSGAGDTVIATNSDFQSQLSRLTG